jgi:hypothetical protein
MPLGALSQAWVSVEASLPLGWQLSGLWRFDDLWGRPVGMAAGKRRLAAGSNPSQRQLNGRPPVTPTTSPVM